METVEMPKNIFYKARVAKDFYVLALFFYFPIGVTLAFVRFFIGCHAFLINLLLKPFPTLRCYVLRIMCAVLGFVVIRHHTERRREDAKVVVTNHITNFDHLAINLINPCVVPSVWDLPSSLIWMLGYRDFGVTQGRPVFVDNVKNFLKDSELPLLAFPEGATTSGKVATLKFNAWPFSLGETIQPVALQILQPPLLHVSTSILGSRWWSDMFWHLFLPYTVFVMSYLPVERKRAGESSEDFATRVQHQICNELDLQPTSITSYQKVIYAKSLCNNDVASRKQL